MHLILYGKPGCHLCEGLQEKLEQIQRLQFVLEIRDITTREDWFQAYQYEIPVLFMVKGEESENGRQETRNSQHGLSFDSPSLIPIPRFSPRASVAQMERVLQKHLSENSENKAK